MAASQVVLYFDRQEDAVQFTLAASSIIADGAPPTRNRVESGERSLQSLAHHHRRHRVSGDAPKAKRKAQ